MSKDKVEIQNEVREQVEIVEDTKGVSYLSPELISDGQARNIVTVKVTTRNGVFLVDVLKQNALYKLATSELRDELLDVSIETTNANLGRTTELSLIVTYETLIDCIVKPRLVLRDNKLYIDDLEVPGDVIDLLVEAERLVNKPKEVSQAVDLFQDNNK